MELQDSPMFCLPDDMIQRDAQAPDVITTHDYDSLQQKGPKNQQEKKTGRAKPEETGYKHLRISSCWSYKGRQ